MCLSMQSSICVCVKKQKPRGRQRENNVYVCIHFYWYQSVPVGLIKVVSQACFSVLQEFNYKIVMLHVPSAPITRLHKGWDLSRFGLMHI